MLPAKTRGGSKGFYNRHRNNIEGYAFISLFIVGFVLFTVVPIVTSLFLSFADYDVLSPPKFVGLKNYIRMFTDDKQFFTCWCRFRCV